MSPLLPFKRYVFGHSPHLSLYVAVAVSTTRSKAAEDSPSLSASSVAEAGVFVLTIITTRALIEYNTYRQRGSRLFQYCDACDVVKMCRRRS